MGEQRTRDFKVPLTLEEFIGDMKEAHTNTHKEYFVTHHICGVCGLPIGWVVDGDIVKYEDSCMCRENPHRYSSFKSMYINLVSHRTKDEYELTLKRYGLYEAYRKTA